MIAVDTSALIEVAGRQPRWAACQAALLENSRLLVSAATLTETLIVGSRPEFREAVGPLLRQLELEIVAVDAPFAERAANAYKRWGKGFHPARLNYGDCFSYALAELHDCSLLYVSEDFGRTDIRSALAT